MEIYGILQLSNDHSVHPRYVETDHKGKPVINFTGSTSFTYWETIKKKDIVGFGQDQIGNEAHILIIPNKKIYPDEIVLDTLEKIRSWFNYDGVM